ncbi:MAG: thiamine-phosphate kinase [Saprospiraceae bacterium]|nr:thiamine-phosphate kinase [Saprospiraceae bacterium]HMW39355.1 thiamine-phosphate kinase [Saprospiraceae bacterium]HMX89523.1 thiamine-phosphate kinase [Saprospiraceae bacterium]HMZ41336.1 thiamine-phosphate kinase [Saprospiraceae bacterium]HNA65009.1 thiamine-phosphate kinase [Saprospiraceae bacterium]
MSRTELNELGEFALIDHLTQEVAIHHQETILGIGDDAAVIENKDSCTLVSTDLLIEGIHFDLMYHPLKHLGYKAVIVNLSDILAMNAVPKQITVSVAVSNRFSVEALEQLYEGIRTACNLYKIDLVGGDTTASPKGLIISITVIGTQQKDKIVKRNGAKPGDYIYVTGYLGGAYLGLQLLEREKRIYQEHPDIQPQLGENREILERILKPEARMDIIRLLDKNHILPSAMIDLSDGLSSDLLHICKQSGTGALIEEQNIPIQQEAQLMALEFHLDPITCALSGGEDYELLICVPPDLHDKVKTLPSFYYIGEITAPENGVRLKTTHGNFHNITAQGWKHF